ncbi:MAG: purine-nucleoside phosphorylase [Bdellovibrionales bacterium]|nr:purine-nucleoside phosphorylase [Bdellovibrionales bacterium]
MSLYSHLVEKSPYEKIIETVDFIKHKTSLAPKTSITLGSGLASFADQIDVEVKIPYSEIPHFSPPTVEGHPGQLIIGKLADKDIAVLQGRIHYYEGHPFEHVMFPTRVLGVWGIKNIILTNAAGGMADGIQEGCFMVLTDHINLMGENPLRGANVDELGPRFPDMSEVYDRALNEKLEGILQKHKVDYYKGIYAAVSGPTYETPAEVQYLKQIGAGAVGMSTAPEAIAAKHMGLSVCGISCITNLAAGISKQPLSHEEVKVTASRVEKQFCSFLKEFAQSL